MIKLVSVSEMQAIEREADAHALSYTQMMENAGSGLASIISQRYGSGLRGRAGLQAGGLVGSGNNGGDTLVALSVLAESGWVVSACVVRARPADDPLIDRFLKSGGILWAMDDMVAWLKNFPPDAVLLDGVLGTGTRLPIKPDLANVLKIAKATLLGMTCRPYIVAVDCPSGIDCDTGEAAPVVIPAELTITMAAMKRGLLAFPAYHSVGEIILAGIGPIDHLMAWINIPREVVDEQRVRFLLPSRPLDAHKGTFGTVLVVAGSVSYPGAAFLAGKAAYRSGVGWVTMAVPEPVYAAVAGHFPEAPWLVLPHKKGYIAADAAQIVSTNLGKTTAILLGPGFGMDPETGIFLSELLSPELPPLILDADGLKLIAKYPNWPSRLPKLSILTPHPGEMAVLTGISLDEIQRDRISIAEKFAKRWGHVVVLKGAFTVIASPDGRTAVIPVATPALAKAGTGDVLAGLVSGFRAQGMAAYEAALIAAWLHAEAGLEVAKELGTTACVVAGDVLNAIVRVMGKIS